jgi:hypothetical protein
VVANANVRFRGKINEEIFGVVFDARFGFKKSPGFTQGAKGL